MKKLFTLMMLCLSVSATAWAQITEEWTNAAPPHSRPIISTYPMSYSGTNKVHAVTQVIKVETQGNVGVTLTITAGTLNVLGIDLATANGTVQASYYTAKELTTSDGSYTATLSDVPAGYYVLRYFVHNNASENANLDNTSGSLTVRGAVQAPVISNLANLSNDKVYLVKSGRTDASKDVYLLYNSASDASGYLSSNYKHESENKSLYDGLENFQFAIYKHTDNKYYFYIPKGKKIVGNETENNTAIPLRNLPDTDMEIRTTSTVDNYPFLLSTNRSGALNVALTNGQHGVVNWSDSNGYNQTGDAGNAFQFIEAGDLADDVKTLLQNKIMYAPDYRTAQALLASVDPAYVGQYIYADLEQLSTALTNFANSTTVDNYNTMMTEYNQARSTASRVTLGNGEIFQIKCTNASRGYLAYYNTTNDTFDGATTLTLAGANGWNAFPNIDAANVYTTWAMYKYNDKCYLYSTKNKKFIKAGNPLTFTEDVAQASPVTLENIDGNDIGWRLKLIGTSNYISFSPGYGLNGGARIYNDASDAGVQHYLIKTGSSVSDADAGPIARKILLPVLASKTPTLGTGIGEYTYSGSDQATDEANIATAKSYVDGTVTPTEAEILAAITNMTNLYSSLTINQPTAGKLYRFKGKTSQRYMKSNGAGSQMTVSANLDPDNGPATIFMVIKDDDRYKLLSYDLGLYANETRSIGSAVNNFNTYSFLKSEGGNAGYYTIKSNYSGAQYLWSNTSKTDRNGEYAEGNCDWEIEEVPYLPVPIYNDTYKLGTFYSPVALTQNTTRIKFYTGTVTNNYFNLTQYTGNVIPANTAFVTEYVKDGQTSNNCAYLLIASDPTPTTEQQKQLDNNQLQGQFETITTPTITGKTICTMQEISSALTFASYTGTTVKGFRAYLPVDNSTTGGGDSSFRLVFGVPTGIDTIGNQPAQEQTVYDLSGRRVEHAGKGLYIVNGKKVMIK